MSIPDWLFYPLITIFIAVLIVFSVNYWPGHQPESDPFSGLPEDGFIISGKQLGLMQTGPGLNAELIAKEDRFFLHTAAGQGPDEGVRSAGVFLTLPSVFSTAYGGSLIELTMEVRGGEAKPAPEMTLTYYAPGRGNSPHTKCILTPQWQPCTMRYTPLPATAKANVDYFGMWPDLDGLSRTVDIRAIKVRPVNSETPP